MIVFTRRYLMNKQLFSSNFSLAVINPDLVPFAKLKLEGYEELGLPKAYLFDFDRCLSKSEDYYELSRDIKNIEECTSVTNIARALIDSEFKIIVFTVRECKKDIGEWLESKQIYYTELHVIENTTSRHEMLIKSALVTGLKCRYEICGIFDGSDYLLEIPDVSTFNLR